MLGIQELKEKLKFTNTEVECPIKNCQEKVERQRMAFKREDRFKCPKHDIFISTTSFEYQSELDNLLWKDQNDISLLSQIKTIKRESRIGRDTSEVFILLILYWQKKNKISERFSNNIFKKLRIGYFAGNMGRDI